MNADDARPKIDGSAADVATPQGAPPRFPQSYESGHGLSRELSREPGAAPPKAVRHTGSTGAPPPRNTGHGAPYDSTAPTRAK